MRHDIPGARVTCQTAAWHHRDVPRPTPEADVGGHRWRGRRHLGLVVGGAAFLIILFPLFFHWPLADLLQPDGARTRRLVYCAPPRLYPLMPLGRLCGTIRLQVGEELLAPQKRHLPGKHKLP